MHATLDEGPVSEVVMVTEVSNIIVFMLTPGLKVLQIDTVQFYSLFPLYWPIN